MRIGYHASHEQHRPGDLLRYAQLAEEAGFQEAMCSDHIAPFSERHAHSGFAWSWLGAALQSTQLSWGVVTTPGWRYHPAILAHAIATLGDMFPGRFWTALGSGEQLNEHIVARRWPEKSRRNTVLRDSHSIIKRLIAGETVTSGEPVPTEEARLYVTPEVPPLLVGAAITAGTARWMGGWADAMITVGGPRDSIREVIEAFREGGGAGKPIYLQAQHSFAETNDAARQAALDNWRVATLGSGPLGELRTPAQMDAATDTARVEDVADRIRCSADPGQHLEWVREYYELGFEKTFIHNVERNEERFIASFGEHVLSEAAKWE